MSLVNKYIDSGSFLTATAVYDDINLTTKATDGYYQFGGQYRRQVSGALLTATVCADCFTFDSLDYVSTSSGDLCCLTQTPSQYYYPTGLTFLTTTNIYTDVNLSNIAANGYYSEPNGSQFRQITGGVLGSITGCSSCYTSVSLDYNNSENGLCCVSQTSGGYYVDYGTTLATTSGVYSDNTGTAATDGFYQVNGSSTYRQQSSGSLGSTTSCPTCALPSILASTQTPTNVCQTPQATAIYFEVVPPATNTFPVVGDNVFTDSSGLNPLNNTSTIYYYVSGTIALGVQNGAVVSSATCTSGTAFTSFFATAGTSSLSDGKCGSLCDTLLYHNGTGTLPQAGDIIYAGSTTGSQTVTWTDYRGFGNFDGDSAYESGIVNASGVIQTVALCP